MNTISRLTSLATCCLLLLAACANHANASIQQADGQFTSISRLLEQADLAFDNNAPEEAVRLYGSSMRAYQQFSESFPDFAPDLVRFRMAYCRNQIASIRQRITQRQLASQNDPAKPAGTTPHAATPNPVPPDLLAALLDENFELVRSAALAMQDDPAQKPAALFLLAAAHLAEGDLPAARLRMEQVLEILPDQAAAFYNLAQLILREPTPDLDQARSFYRRARELGAPQDLDLETVLNF